MSDRNGCFRRAHALACLPTRPDLAGKSSGNQSPYFYPRQRKILTGGDKPDNDALEYLFNFLVGAIDLVSLAPLLSPAKGGLPIPVYTTHGGKTKNSARGNGDVVMCCCGGEVRWRFDTNARWLQAR